MTRNVLHKSNDYILGTAFWYFLRGTMRIVDPVAVITWFRPPMDRGIPANGTPQPPHPNTTQTNLTGYHPRPRHLHNPHRRLRPAYPSRTTHRSLRRRSTPSVPDRLRLRGASVRQSEETVRSRHRVTNDSTPYRYWCWLVPALDLTDASHGGDGYWGVWKCGAYGAWGSGAGVWV